MIKIVALGALVLAAGSPALAAPTPAPAPTTRAQNDERMTDCNRWHGAEQRLLAARDELAHVPEAFAADDELRSKTADLVRYLSDDLDTLRKREADRCAGMHFGS